MALGIRPGLVDVRGADVPQARLDHRILVRQRLRPQDVDVRRLDGVVSQPGETGLPRRRGVGGGWRHVGGGAGAAEILGGFVGFDRGGFAHQPLHEPVRPRHQAQASGAKEIDQADVLGQQPGHGRQFLRQRRGVVGVHDPRGGGDGRGVAFEPVPQRRRR